MWSERCVGGEGGGSFAAIKYGKFIQQATQISSSFQEVHL